jgi:thioredoxin-like negative regulator of GroEL
MDAIIERLTTDTFSRAVSEGLTVIDLWAGSCGPCLVMAPQFKRAAELRPQYRFAKVDLDAAPELAGRFGIRSIPTLTLPRDGEPLGAQPGLISAEPLVESLDRLAAAGSETAIAQEAA